MAGWLRAHAIHERKLIIADTFKGLPPPTREQDGGLDLTKEKFPQLAVSRAIGCRNSPMAGSPGRRNYV